MAQNDAALRNVFNCTMSDLLSVVFSFMDSRNVVSLATVNKQFHTHTNYFITKAMTCMKIRRSAPLVFFSDRLFTNKFYGVKKIEYKSPQWTKWSSGVLCQLLMSQQFKQVKIIGGSFQYHDINIDIAINEIDFNIEQYFKPSILEKLEISLFAPSFIDLLVLCAPHLKALKNLSIMNHKRTIIRQMIVQPQRKVTLRDKIYLLETICQKLTLFMKKLRKSNVNIERVKLFTLIGLRLPTRFYSNSLKLSKQFFKLKGLKELKSLELIGHGHSTEIIQEILKKYCTKLEILTISDHSFHPFGFEERLLTSSLLVYRKKIHEVYGGLSELIGYANSKLIGDKNIGKEKSIELIIGRSEWQTMLDGFSSTKIEFPTNIIIKTKYNKVIIRINMFV